MHRTLQVQKRHCKNISRLVIKTVCVCTGLWCKWWWCVGQCPFRHISCIYKIVRKVEQARLTAFYSIFLQWPRADCALFIIQQLPRHRWRLLLFIIWENCFSLLFGTARSQRPTFARGQTPRILKVSAILGHTIYNIHYTGGSLLFFNT